MTTIIIEIKDWFMWLITICIGINVILGLIKYYLNWRIKNLKRNLSDDWDITIPTPEKKKQPQP